MKLLPDEFQKMDSSYTGDRDKVSLNRKKEKIYLTFYGVNAMHTPLALTSYIDGFAMTSKMLSRTSGKTNAFSGFMSCSAHELGKDNGGSTK